MLPTVQCSALPAVDREEMARVDQEMVEGAGIVLPQMMEHAGRTLARLALALRGEGDAPLVVLAGPGGNGGGALVAARRLAGWGLGVGVWLTAPDRLTPVTAGHARTLAALGVPVHATGAPPVAGAVVLDGMVGYGVTGALGGRAREWAEAVTASRPSVVLALDLPSGLDASDGSVAGAVVRADATLTLALPKTGLLRGRGPECAGTLYLADIGVPAALLERLGHTPSPPFEVGDILRLTR